MLDEGRYSTISIGDPIFRCRTNFAITHYNGRSDLQLQLLHLARTLQYHLAKSRKFLIAAEGFNVLGLLATLHATPFAQLYWGNPGA